MRIAILFLLLGASAVAQHQSRSQTERPVCGCSSANVLYRTVVHEMWSQDEGDYSFTETSGFIRIAVHPNWSPEVFVDVRLNKKGAAKVVLYSLPKGTQYLTELLKKELSQHPCADPKSLAKMLGMKKQSFDADKKIEELLVEFFAMRWEPRRIPAVVRVDATEYELEFVGDDKLSFDSDDYETPMVKWIESFLSVVYDAAPR